jgi:hypothetical protein
MLNGSFSPTFLQYAVDILADTNSGLSGPMIVKATAIYAIEYDISLPHPHYPFDAANKRSALLDNLLAFSAKQQYRIIKELCDHHSLSHASIPRRRELKLRLLTRYSHLAGEAEPGGISESLISEARHWLDSYPSALALYNSAIQKYDGKIFFRNLLDDLRLALESLLRDLLANDKSLENQQSPLGLFLKSKGGSKELSNMFLKLVEYFASYQNTYIKQDDAVIEEEVEFIFEVTSAFMKHLIRMTAA